MLYNSNMSVKQTRVIFFLQGLISLLGPMAIPTLFTKPQHLFGVRVLEQLLQLGVSRELGWIFAFEAARRDKLIQKGQEFIF